MKKRAMQKRIFRVLMLSLTILLIGGGIGAFCLWHQGPISGQANSGSVVGPPSLPAATVDAIFRRVGSSMVGTGQAVETAARAANIDDAFALAVWWTETNDGEAGVGRADRNPGSVRGSTGYPSAYDGYTIYPSYTAAVNYWFPMLKRNYINRGLTTVSAIAHPYVGTSTSYLWAGKVIALMNRYRGEAPQPTATPKQAQTPPAGVRRVQQSLAQRQQEQTSGVPSTTAPASSQQQTRQTAVAPSGAVLLLLFMLFVLVAVLAVGLQVWHLRKRYVSEPTLKLPALSTENLWANLRASHQQPFVLLRQRPPDSLLPITEDLSISAAYTGTLGATPPARLEEPHTPRTFPGDLSPQTLHATPVAAGQTFFGLLHKEPVEQLPFDAPVRSYASRFSAPQQHFCQTPCPSVSPSVLTSASNEPHRSGWQSATSMTPPSRLLSQTPALRPQRLDAQNASERSGGLLSRYRATQIQQQQEG
jgi:hypothetical protein